MITRPSVSLTAAPAWGLTLVATCALPMALLIAQGAVAPPSSAGSAPFNDVVLAFKDGRRGASEKNWICTDVLLGLGGSQSVYERATKELRARGEDPSDRYLRIVTSYVPAPPAKYWTIEVGGECGSAYVSVEGWGARATYVIDRATGEVHDEAWADKKFPGREW